MHQNHKTQPATRTVIKQKSAVPLCMKGTPVSPARSNLTAPMKSMANFSSANMAYKSHEGTHMPMEHATPKKDDVTPVALVKNSTQPNHNRGSAAAVELQAVSAVSGSSLPCPARTTLGNTHKHVGRTHCFCAKLPFTRRALCSLLCAQIVPRWVYDIRLEVSSTLSTPVDMQKCSGEPRKPQCVSNAGSTGWC